MFPFFQTLIHFRSPKSCWENVEYKYQVYQVLASYYTYSVSNINDISGVKFDRCQPMTKTRKEKIIYVVLELPTPDSFAHTAQSERANTGTTFQLTPNIRLPSIMPCRFIIHVQRTIGLSGVICILGRWGTILVLPSRTTCGDVE